MNRWFVTRAREELWNKTAQGVRSRGILKGDRAKAGAEVVKNTRKVFRVI